MGTFRGRVRKDSTRGTQPAEVRLGDAGLLTPADDVAALPGILSGLAVTGVASQWYYAVAGGHGVTVRSSTDGANMPGLTGVTNTPTVAAAPSSGSRWDLIYLWQKDADAGDGASDAVLGVVQGAASGTPTKRYDLVPAGALVLAEAQVGSGATGTLHANVTITQVAAKVGLRGGIISNPTTAQQTLLNAAASATNPIWIDDAGVLKRSVGAGFVAKTVADATDTGWVTQTPSAGWTSYSSFQTRVIGRMVFVRGLFRPDSGAIAASSSPNVLVLPAGVRPGRDYHAAAVSWVAGGTPLYGGGSCALNVTASTGQMTLTVSSFSALTGVAVDCPPWGLDA